MGFCSHDPKRAGLVNPLAAEASRWFMESYGMPATFFTDVLSKPWFRPIVNAFERSTIPGILLHYLVRKRYLEETARKFLGQGIRQVVILGAGFDVLAVYLHSIFPEVTFFEVDYPATQSAKEKVIARKSLAKGNLIFVPVDLTKGTWAESLLSSSRYQPDQNTLFISEGVLMYLSQADVDKLFAFINEHAGTRSVFAFTFMEPRSDGKVNFRNRSKIVDFWMHLRGEPFTWGIPREKLPGYLRSVGFSQEDLATPDIFRERYLNDESWAQEPLAEGEYVCVAKRMPSR